MSLPYPKVWLSLAKSLTDAWFLFSDSSFLVLPLSQPASQPRSWMWCNVGPGSPPGITGVYPSPFNPSPGMPKCWSVRPGCSFLVFIIHHDSQLRFNSSTSMWSCVLYNKYENFVWLPPFSSFSSVTVPFFMPHHLLCLALYHTAFCFSIALLSAVKNSLDELINTKFCIVDILILCMKICGIIWCCIWMWESMWPATALCIIYDTSTRDEGDEKQISFLKRVLLG